MDGTSPTEQIHTLVFPALPTTTQDTVREHTDVINAEIRPVEEALHGFRNSVQAKSADEDQLASISLEADATSITEGETVTFTLTRGNSTAGELIVGVTVDDPGGFLKGNYAGEAVEVPSSLVFAPGEITKEVTLTPPDDWRDIPDSTLNFTVDADLGYEIVGSPSSTVQVADNDVAPQVQISFNHGEVDEGEDLVLTITRIGEDKNPLEVEMALGPVGSQTHAVFVIGIGEPHLTTTYNLPDDQFKGPDTHYQVTLHPGDPEFWVPTGATTIYGSILDNDLYTVGVSTLSHSVDEGQLIDYLIFHDGHTGEPLEVNVNRSEIGSAVADSLLSATTHTINAGSSGLNLTIPTTANDGSDGTALFNVEILPGDGYTVDPNHDSVHIAVEDVDPLPVLSLRSGAEVAVSEGIGTVEIWVDLTSTLPVLREVEVDYEILEVATAEDGEDFTASVGTLVFSPGETSKAVEVPILQDNLAEYDERFAVELKNPVFADLEDGETTLTARVVITDDEPIVSMEAAAAAVNEGFAAIFNLTRKRNTTDELTVWLKVIWSAPEASTTRVSATFPAGHATTQFTVPHQRRQDSAGHTDDYHRLGRPRFHRAALDLLQGGCIHPEHHRPGRRVSRCAPRFGNTPALRGRARGIHRLARRNDEHPANREFERCGAGPVHDRPHPKLCHYSGWRRIGGVRNPDRGRQPGRGHRRAHRDGAGQRPIPAQTPQHHHLPNIRQRRRPAQSARDPR